MIWLAIIEERTSANNDGPNVPLRKDLESAKNQCVILMRPELIADHEIARRQPRQIFARELFIPRRIGKGAERQDGLLSFVPRTESSEIGRAGLAAQHHLGRFPAECFDPRIPLFAFLLGKQLRQMAVLEIGNPSGPCASQLSQWKTRPEIVRVVVG